MLSVLVFDSIRARVAGSSAESLLAPITDLRAVFDVRTGALTTLERMTMHARLNDLPKPDALLVASDIEAIVRERHAGVGGGIGGGGGGLVVNERLTSNAGVLLVNGSCPLVDTDTTGVELGHAQADCASGIVVKAHVPTDRISSVLSGDLSGLTVHTIDAPVLTRPWHVRAHRDACLKADLKLIERSRTDWVRPPSQAGLFISASASVHPSAIFDTDGGPIIVDGHATVRPGAILVGPVYVGSHSFVLERAIIRPGTAIGPHCKVAGEVGGTIFQGFSNKAHDGYLGDSYVGEWVNLGAGTTNSNLLNTYGEIVTKPLTAAGKPGSNERTGQQFLGCVLGDHVKSAICTRIMTGSIVGTGTMFAASRPISGTIERFRWMTDSDDGPMSDRPYRVDKCLEVIRASMARRKLVPTAAYEARVRVLAGG